MGIEDINYKLAIKVIAEAKRLTRAGYGGVQFVPPANGMTDADYEADRARYWRRKEKRNAEQNAAKEGESEIHD